MEVLNFSGVMRLNLLICALLVGLSSRVQSDRTPSLRLLPSEKLAQLAPLLRSADVVLLESDERGWEKQITCITLAAAAPESVREVVIHPERYSRFVRNMGHSAIRPGPNGTLDHDWKLSYTLASFSGVNRYTFLPAEHGESAPPVLMADPTGMSHYRWEFLPASTGGGTVVVLYGYTDVRHSGGFVEKVLERASTLEHGLALTTQMTLLLAMKEEAERRPGTFVPYKSEAVDSHAVHYDFLLERGLVSLLRRQNGRLSEVSLIEQTSALPSRLMDYAAHPEKWKEFVPSISRAHAVARKDGLPSAEVEQSLPFMSWTTTFGVQRSANAVDLFGVEGDLRGGRLRWDVQTGHGTQLILRSRLSFDRSNVIMRQLFKIEPLFEYGVNVGMSLVIMRAVKVKAERDSG
jgi:hypothetical protein